MANLVIERRKQIAADLSTSDNVQEYNKFLKNIIDKGYRYTLGDKDGEFKDAFKDLSVHMRKAIGLKKYPDFAPMQYTNYIAAPNQQGNFGTHIMRLKVFFDVMRKATAKSAELKELYANYPIEQESRKRKLRNQIKELFDILIMPVKDMDKKSRKNLWQVLARFEDTLYWFSEENQNDLVKSLIGNVYTAQVHDVFAEYLQRLHLCVLSYFCDVIEKAEKDIKEVDEKLQKEDKGTKEFQALTAEKEGHTCKIQKAQANTSIFIEEHKKVLIKLETGFELLYTFGDTMSLYTAVHKACNLYGSYLDYPLNPHNSNPLNVQIKRAERALERLHDNIAAYETPKAYLDTVDTRIAEAMEMHNSACKELAEVKKTGIKRDIIVVESLIKEYKNEAKRLAEAKKAAIAHLKTLKGFMRVPDSSRLADLSYSTNFADVVTLEIAEFVYANIDNGKKSARIDWLLPLSNNYHERRLDYKHMLVLSYYLHGKDANIEAFIDALLHYYAAQYFYDSTKAITSDARLFLTPKLDFSITGEGWSRFPQYHTDFMFKRLGLSFDKAHSKEAMGLKNDWTQKEFDATYSFYIFEPDCFVTKIALAIVDPDMLSVHNIEQQLKITTQLIDDRQDGVLLPHLPKKVEANLLSVLLSDAFAVNRFHKPQQSKNRLQEDLGIWDGIVETLEKQIYQYIEEHGMQCNKKAVQKLSDKCVDAIVDNYLYPYLNAELPALLTETCENELKERVAKLVTEFAISTHEDNEYGVATRGNYDFYRTVIQPWCIERMGYYLKKYFSNLLNLKDPTSVFIYSLTPYRLAVAVRKDLSMQEIEHIFGRETLEQLKPLTRTGITELLTGESM